MSTPAQYGFDLSETFGLKASGIVNHETLGYRLNGVFAQHAGVPQRDVSRAAEFTAGQP